MSEKIKELLKKNGVEPSTVPPKVDANSGNEGGGNEGGGEGGEGGEGGDAGAAGAGDDKNKGGGVPPKQDQQQQNQPPVEDDIDDEKLLRALEKRGHKFGSVADINKPAEQPAAKTPEELEAEAQQRRDNVRQFGLQNKKVTSTQLDNYARESKMDPVELAYSVFKSERIGELKAAKTPDDQMPDDKTLRDEFDEAHFQYADPTDPKRIRHEKLLKQQADAYIEDKYANILDLDEEYSDFEKTKIQRKNYETVFNQVISSLGDEMEFEIVNDKEKFPFKFKITADKLKPIRDAYLNDTSFTLFGKGDVKPDLLASAVRGNIIQNQFASILSEAAIAYASSKVDAMAKGRRGIPPERKEGGSEGGEKKVNKVIQRVLANTENKKIVQKS